MDKPSIVMVQPRHNYAPSNKETEGHIYTPTSLWTAGSMLEKAGVEVSYQDQNLRPGLGSEESRLIGINLLGAPYIPVAIEVKKEIQRKVRDGSLPKDTKLVIGGQVVDGLHKADKDGNVTDRSQFDKLFGEDAVIGTNKLDLAKALGINPDTIPLPEATSLVPAYEKIPDADMKKYMEREMSFYLSQGCKYACDFCTAARTRVNHDENGVKNQQTVKEAYRYPSEIKSDLEYLVTRAKRLGLQKLDFYLSNLDLFQTPEQLINFAQTVNEIKTSNPNFEIRFRALATVGEFMNLHGKESEKARTYRYGDIKKTGREVIKDLVDSGLHTVGFGVDGWGKELWNSVNKGHNRAIDCVHTIKLAKKYYGLTPEILMVFGHEADTEATMRRALKFAKTMNKQYGAIIRPHLAKNILPHNNHWYDPKNQQQVNFLLDNPQFFQALDFTARASSLSHPDPEHRQVVNAGYDAMLRLRDETEGSTKQEIVSTKAIEPIDPILSATENERRMNENIGKYDH